jgi:hypothetical protein
MARAERGIVASMRRRSRPVLSHAAAASGAVEAAVFQR